MLHIIKYATLI